MHRREFLATTAASAAMLAVGVAGSADAWPCGASNGFNRARFKSWLNREFRLGAQGAPRGFRATLMTVDDGPTHAGLEQFSIVFRGSTALPTGLCRLSPPDGAPFMLHLSGIPGGTLRRAHFSLLEPQHG